MKEHKMDTLLPQILSTYGFPADTSVTPHGTGLINRTWIVRNDKDTYILQQVNHHVFTRPQLIADNIEMVGRYLADHYPAIIFPRPVPSLTGQTLIDAGDNNYYRLFPFIADSVSIDVASTPRQAFEAARQFGGFTSMLADFPADNLHETIPHFHDLSLRYRSFSEALQNGMPQRIDKATPIIDYLQSQNRIVTQYENILTNPAFKRRVTHHDTKISNVLFNKQGNGICVIDLDTVMPGYFISDVGDIFRTYLSPVTEEEKDTDKIRIRQEYFEAILKGYLQEMHNVLTPDEREAFVYAGEFMTYMQALRFLTDYLNNDIYYGRRYEDHNFVRALNQITLLQRFQEQSPLLKTIAASISI
jgi:Ser/Thr protein kinase RdoA (MazF antagonist)